MRDARAARVVGAIAQVLRAAVARTQADGIALAPEDTPEQTLAQQCCTQAIGDERVSLDATAGMLSARSWNKTALLLTRSWPHELLLPLGDLWATQVLELAGGWSAPPDVLPLIESAGGIEPADRALQRWLDAREPARDALAELPVRARGPFLEAVQRGRLWRERSGLVPKLSARTIGIDLFA